MAVTKFKTTSSFTNLTKYDSMLAGNSAYSPPMFESIASAVGTGASATITFSSIAGTYKSLQIRLSGNTSTTQNAWGLRVNGSSTVADYYAHKLAGDGTTVTAAAYSANSYIRLGDTSGVAANQNVAIIDIHDYALTTNKKTVRSLTGNDNNGGVNLITLGSGLYRQTTAITSLSIFSASADWATTTTVALYGIKG